MIEFNINSTNHISGILFGGIFKDIIKEFNGTTKAGKPKFKNVEINKNIEGLQLQPLREWKAKKDGFYSTGEDVLKAILNGKIDRLNKDKNLKLAKEICETLLKIRELEKQITTYYDGMELLIQENDNCLHAQYPHVSTDTGRLSSAKPNLQNQPKPPSKITEHFISRFKDGVLIAADESQLEPRVEAELCQDKNLIRDIKNEVDTHTKNLALAEHKTYEETKNLVEKHKEWKEKRSKIKGFTFSQQYLASIKTTAKNSGLSEKEVENILLARMKEYPKLYSWHVKNEIEINEKGFYSNMLGRKFYFKLYESTWGSSRYSKNEISNYKTQGTASDIVLIMLGKFWREKGIFNRDKYLLINTVHDNCMLDCKQEYIENAKNDMKVLDGWEDFVYNRYQYKWKVPLKLDIKIGKSWYDCF